MKNNNNIIEELEKEAPFLSKIKKENHFSTPNNYFEVLPEVINHKKLNNKLLWFLFDKLSYRILVPISAFSVLLFVVFNLNTNNISTELTPDQLSELIIEDDYLEMDDYLVYEAYAETLEEEGKKTSSDKDEYINYLIENDIDINSIIEEL
jgi:hypothetical protein